MQRLFYGEGMVKTPGWRVVAARETSASLPHTTLLLSTALLLLVAALTGCGAPTASGSETSVSGSETSASRSEASASGSGTSASRSETSASGTSVSPAETQVVAVMDSAAEQVVRDANAHAQQVGADLAIEPRTASGSDEIAQWLRRGRVDAALYSVPEPGDGPEWEVVVHREIDPRLRDSLASAVPRGELVVTEQQATGTTP